MVIVQQLLTRHNLLSRSTLRMNAVRGRLRGRTVFCVGNGPSLSERQLRIVRNYPVIATNRAHQLFDVDRFSSASDSFIIINDDARCREVLPVLPSDIENVVYSTYLPSAIADMAEIYRDGWIFSPAKWKAGLTRRGLSFNPDRSPGFSHHFNKVYYPGKSVIFSAIQFAAYLGAKEVVLVGCDMDYTGTRNYSQLIKPERRSIGHLGSFDYVIDGAAHMRTCRDALEKINTKLLNATPGGAIEELDRVDIKDYQ